MDSWIYCIYWTQYKSNENAKKPPSKSSSVLKLMNKMLYTVFGFQAGLVIIFSILSSVWQNSHASTHYYLGLEDQVSFGQWIIRVFIFLVAYSHLIPISLYVALELLKLIQGWLIKKDKDLYYAPLDKHAMVKTSDLVEEIGQIEFIFSDKTGTLTCNQMEFKKCSINAISYGEISKEERDQLNQGTKPKFSVDGDTKAYEHLLNKNSSECKKIHDYFTLLAVCHTVVVDENPKPGQEQKYQASSPDELALVEGAVSMGYKFVKRTSNSVIISILDQISEEWEIFCEIPFDSTRKRMSLIVKKCGAETYTLMTKGADSIMLPRIIIDENTLNTTKKHLDGYALEGLRTLVMGQREMSQSEFHGFMKEFESIKSSSSPNKNQQLDDLFNKTEKNLLLVGCSAIEDKLQNGVPETIAILMEAGIKIWVLTGDKQETAIEIGKSCQLIRPEMEVIILSASSQNEFLQKLEYHIQDNCIDLRKPVKSIADAMKDVTKLVCIVIDGPTLIWALDPSAPEINKKFFRLGLIANSCICCRVTPKQKADVVALAKKNGKWITLAIGDGANDVSMIMEAHVGVGVHGKEGTQAVRSADFAIAQFEYLKKLLLVHGRWAYRRVSIFICYYFYKNIIVVFTEIYFAFFNGYSGQIFFLDWLPMMYNAFWTSWPCMFNYAFDQDVNKQYSLKYPKLYKAGQINFYFNMKMFWLWIIYAIYHGAICFWLPVFGLQGVNDGSGVVKGHWFNSTISFSLIMHIVTLKLFLETYFWNPINIGIGFLSLIFYYFCIMMLNVPPFARLVQPQMEMLVFSIFASARAWFTILLVPFLALGPDIIGQMIWINYFASPVVKVMQLQLVQKDAEELKSTKEEPLLFTRENESPSNNKSKNKNTVEHDQEKVVNLQSNNIKKLILKNFF